MGEISETLEEPGLPPEEVRIVRLQTESWGDGKRIRVLLEMTPFQSRPDIEAAILDPSGTSISKIDIIENMEQKLVFTMHLRLAQPEERYRLSVKMSYRNIGVVDEKWIEFSVYD